MSDQTQSNPKADAPVEVRKTPRYIAELVRAARLVEAHSHYDEASNEYHVDPHAMACLCGAIGNRKIEQMEAQ